MHMKMVDGLAAVGPGIDNQTITPTFLMEAETLLVSDLDRYGEQVSEQRLILAGGVREGAEVLLGYEQDMHRGLGMDVGEGEQTLVFIESGDRDGPGGDLAEEAVGVRSHKTVDSKQSTVDLSTS
jgi:hypothetical protein